MIVCGWCGASTAEGSCSVCGRDPSVPWVQRDQVPPIVDAAEIARRKLAEAGATLGRDVTVERIAEHFDVSPRTVRRWRELVH